MLELLNADVISSRRISLTEADLTQSKDKHWECHYCKKKTASEVVFMKHHCEEKRRVIELTSPIGQAAFSHYREWMRLKKYSQPKAEAFMQSKYYRAFINFAQLIIDANIAKPEKYIELMVKGDLMPPLWCRDSAYGEYLDWVDKLVEPFVQVQESISYLFDLCEKENVQIENIFKHLGANKIIALIHQRRLTPWLLFCAATFGDLLRTLDRSEQDAFGRVVKPSYWGGKFDTEQATVMQIKKLTKEFGL